MCALIVKILKTPRAERSCAESGGEMRQSKQDSIAKVSFLKLCSVCGEGVNSDRADKDHLVELLLICTSSAQLNSFSSIQSSSAQ